VLSQTVHGLSSLFSGGATATGLLERSPSAERLTSGPGAKSLVNETAADEMSHVACAAS
jgi:hypothetical protein